MILKTAHADGPHVRIRLPQDPGQAGKAQTQALVGKLAGYSVAANPVTGDKVTRFSPFSAQAEAGNVDLVSGVPDAFLTSLENFGEDCAHDDDADAVSTAFEEFVVSKGGANLIEFYRQQAAERAEKGNGKGNGGHRFPVQDGAINGGVSVTRREGAWHE